jgi:hypothetical protein
MYRGGTRAWNRNAQNARLGSSPEPRERKKPAAWQKLKESEFHVRSEDSLRGYTVNVKPTPSNRELQTCPFL